MIKKEKASQSNNSIRLSIFDFGAFSLIILSHFVNYVVYLKYYNIFPDILIVIIFVFLLGAVLAVVAKLGGALVRAIIFAILITLVLGDVIFEYGVAEGRTGLFAASLTLLVSIALALFLDHHTSKVLAGAFAAFLFTTLLLPQLRATPHMSGDEGPLEKASPGRPVILHLVLDEHIGLAGINGRQPGGDRLAKDMAAFFTSHGFRIFSHAYSQYFDTQMSLASILNFDGGPGVEALLEKGRGTWTLLANRYFSELARRGYSVRIYQSDYMDFCRTTGINVETCLVYNVDKFSPETVADLPLGERVWLITNMYYSSIAIIRLLKFAGTSINDQLESYRLVLPELGLWHGRLGPIAVLPTLERLGEDLSHSSGQTLFFAHLMIPHYPYVLQPDCAIRTPISGWELRFQNDGTNTQDSRRHRYSAYYEQIRCTLRKLAVLFDAMKAAGSYEEAIILIHGDHGSRIDLIEPMAENLTRLTADDYIDNFSTLFAAKIPGLSPGIEGGAKPISAILPHLLGISVPSANSEEKPEAYFITNEDTYVKSPIVLEVP